MQSTLAELNTAQKFVGFKQTSRAIKDGIAQKVFVAYDASPAIISEIHSLCGKFGIQPILAFTMREIGDACGIDVGASVAVIIKPV